MIAACPLDKQHAPGMIPFLTRHTAQAHSYITPPIPLFLAHPPKAVRPDLHQRLVCWHEQCVVQLRSMQPHKHVCRHTEKNMKKGLLPHGLTALCTPTSSAGGHRPFYPPPRQPRANPATHVTLWPTLDHSALRPLASITPAAARL